jgi:hypothetical protein
MEKNKELKSVLNHDGTIIVMINKIAMIKMSKSYNGGYDVVAFGSFDPIGNGISLCLNEDEDKAKSLFNKIRDSI